MQVVTNCKTCDPQRNEQRNNSGLFFSSGLSYRCQLQVLMLMLSYWGAASCVIAFESARQDPRRKNRIYDTCNTCNVCVYV